MGNNVYNCKLILSVGKLVILCLKETNMFSFFQHVEAREYNTAMLDLSLLDILS